MVSMIIFMMLVDVLLLGVLFSEMMFTCGSLPNSFIFDIGVAVTTAIFLGINSVIKLVRCH